MNKTATLLSLEPIKITADCETCGETFDGFAYGSIRQRHCDPCVEAYEMRIAQMSNPDRMPEALGRSCVPNGYKDYDETKLPEPTLRIAKAKVYSWQFGPVGIGLGGKSRYGKSYVIFELARRWESAKSITVIKDQEIGRMVRENSKNREKLLASIDSCEILVWDDFGFTKMTDAVEGFYGDVLESVNSRNVPIFGTANYGGEELKEKWATQSGERSFLQDRGERIVGRFRDRCNLRIVNIQENDLSLANSGDGNKLQSTHGKQL